VTVRQNAAWALGRLAPKKGRGAVARLAKALGDPEPLVRREVATALGEFGPEARTAVPALLNCFKKDPDTSVRMIALNALVNVVGPEDKAAAADLRTALRDRDPEVVQAAALALGNIGGPEAVPAVPVLCEALQSREANTRRMAAAALAHIGPHASAGVASLTKALTDGDPFVRRNAALGLGRIGQKASAAVPTLAKLLDAKEPEEIRVFAAEALGQISPEVEPVIPTLLHHLREDGNWRVRQRAVWALARLNDPEKAGVLPALLAVLSETDFETRLVRYDSAIVLGILMGPRAPDKVVDVLLALMKDPQIQIYSGSDAKVTSAGSEAGRGKATVTPNLSGDCRGLAAKSLGFIGRKANRPEIIRILKDAAQSPDAGVREVAEEALGKIQE
jgi:HEAT repeat protein